MERAIAFGGRDLKDFKKMFEEWKRIGKPKRFHYDSTTGKGRAISEYEHKMDEELYRLRMKYLRLKAHMRRKKAIEKKLGKKKV